MKVKQKKFRVATVAIALSILLIIGFLLLKRSYTFRVRPSDLEAYLQTKFPYQKQELIFTARFENPSVNIDPNTDQVILGVSTTVSTLGFSTVKTQAEAKGSVRYEPISGEIFLDSPTVSVQELKIRGLPDRDQKLAREVLQRVLQLYLKEKGR